MNKVLMVELSNGKQLLAVESDKVSEDGCRALDKVEQMLNNPMNGQLSFVPFAPFGEVSLTIQLKNEHITTSYEVTDDKIIKAHEQAWDIFREQKSGIALGNSGIQL